MNFPSKLYQTTYIAANLANLAAVHSRFKTANVQMYCSSHDGGTQTVLFWATANTFLAENRTSICKISHSFVFRHGYYMTSKCKTALYPCTRNLGLTVYWEISTLYKNDMYILSLKSTIHYSFFYWFKYENSKFKDVSKNCAVYCQVLEHFKSTSRSLC